jgi:hypothetical protein
MATLAAPQEFLIAFAKLVEKHKLTLGDLESLVSEKKSPSDESSSDEWSSDSVCSSGVCWGLADNDTPCFAEIMASDTPLPKPVPAPEQAKPDVHRYKTVLCSNYRADGVCSYGEKCQFAHGRGDIHCRYALQCQKENCHFVHEAPPKVQKRSPAKPKADRPAAAGKPKSKASKPTVQPKTQFCKLYKINACKRGPECFYAHHHSELVCTKGHECPSLKNTNYSCGKIHPTQPKKK